MKAQRATERTSTRRREWLSYANVMATVAVFVALGGGAWAVAIGRNDVGAREIAKNAVRSSELKNNKTKGKDVDEDSLAQVPSAANADNATNAANAANATNAANAATVDGNTVRRVAHLSGNVTDRQVLGLAGLQLDVTCSSGGEDLDATTTVAGGEISIIRDDAGGTNPAGTVDDDFNPGDTAQVSTAAAPSDNVIDLRYTGGDGRVVVAELVTDDDIGTGDCVVSGFAIGG